MMASPLSVPGAYVSLESVPWLSELSTRDTPESLMIAREEEPEDEDDEAAERDAAVLRGLRVETLRDHLACIPSIEALAITLHLGLCGYPRTAQREIAGMLGLKSEQMASYYACRARLRLMYLAARPVVHIAALSSVLTPAQLAVVSDVYDTASFTEAARRRWTCPEDRAGTRRHSWMRSHANKIKRAFFRSLAKIERRPELVEQHAALLHLLAHLGTLSRHEGKGSWWAKAQSCRSATSSFAPSPQT